MKTIAVFASGNGTNLQAIIDNIKKNTLKVRLAFVLSDNSAAFALKRAQRAGVKTIFLDPKKFSSKEAYDKEISGYLKDYKVDLVVLAGFMRILSPFFVKKFRNRILNIHPALLPAFKGASAIKDAFIYGAKVTGVTVHFVDEKIDHGPIIAQECLEVKEAEPLDKLEGRIHKLEHDIYPKAIAMIASGGFSVVGRKVVFRKKW